MPAKLDRCVKKVKKQGKDESSAYAICSSSTGIKRKKGGGWKKEMKESIDKVEITRFIQKICDNDFSKAADHLQMAVNEKIKKRISNLSLAKEEKQ